MSERSPLTHKTNTRLERSIPSAFLVEEYQKSYGIDVSSYFEGLPFISIHQCEDTGFRFYSPSNIDGDSFFYEQLQQFPWYYMSWKWEHEVVKNSLSPQDKVLEIGSAQGAFVERLKDEGFQATGLELNTKAVAIAKEKGLKVYGDTIQQHALTNEEAYDVVCSFQVMEHIADTKTVIDASITALKKGGKLIISVPNNHSFIRHSPNSILNMPPHHMCLWDEVSLTNLQKLFPLTLDTLAYEPLQSYHYGVVWSNGVQSVFKNRLLVKIVNRITTLLQMHKLVALRKSSIVGHSIIATYTKV